MCHEEGLRFIARAVEEREIRGRTLLEVGSLNVNGSPRSVLEPFGPLSYVGVDLSPGPGVDECISADDLVERFGCEAFDVVVSTEMLEHAEDWRRVITNLKGVIKPSGLLLITTRSKGYGYHAYPHDFWRFELADMTRIFRDFEIERLEDDPVAPGVFMRARKPVDFHEADIGHIRLHSMARSRRRLEARRLVMGALACITPRWIKKRVRRVQGRPESDELTHA